MNNSNRLKMDEINIFDKYLKGELSEQDKKDFENRLKSDKEFDIDFKMYLMVVKGICAECQQDNYDFAYAMENLDNKQLKEILDSERRGPQTNDNDIVRKTNRIKLWILSAISIASVVVITITAVLRIEYQKNIDIDNAIYTCSEMSFFDSRGGDEVIDISKMSDTELVRALPTLKDKYNTSEIPEDKADNGFALAMVYIKLHKRAEAKVILNELITEFKGDQNFSDSVNQWRSILKLL